MIIASMPSPAATTDAESDEAAMLRFASGDADAFERLYERHGLRVWRYLLRHVRDASLADDLLQDVWFAVARQAQQYRPTARFTTWVFTMAHHRVVDHWRTVKPHLPLDAGHNDLVGDGAPSLAETLTADSGFGPFRQLQSQELAAALLKAIGQLPHEQKAAFLLQAEAGMSVQEIALTTGVALETARSRLRYARQGLRRMLQEYA